MGVIRIMSTKLDRKDERTAFEMLSDGRRNLEGLE